MQVDVTEQGRYDRPLWSAYLCPRPLAILGYPGPEPFLDQAEYPWVCDATFQKLHKPRMIYRVKEALDVRIQYPVYLPLDDPDPDRIQRIMLAALWPESVAEPEKILFIDLG